MIPARPYSRLLACLVATAALMAQVVFDAIASPAQAVNTDADPSDVSWWSTGDSYSSGEGIPFTEGDCAQHADAWGPTAASLVANEHGWAIEQQVFTACTGHLVGDTYVRRGDTHGRGSFWEWAVGQAGESNPVFDVITMSFGGNDLGFDDVIKDCTGISLAGWSGLVDDDLCAVTESELVDRIDALTADGAGDAVSRCAAVTNEEFGCQGAGGRRFHFDTGPPGGISDAAGSLADFYVAIVERHLSARGALIVVTYPRMHAPSSEWRAWQLRCGGFEKSTADMVGRMSQRLEDTIVAQVAAANEKLGAERVHVVSAIDVFGGRDGARNGGAHELCGAGEDWINSLVTATPSVTGSRLPSLAPRFLGAYHPTREGHVAEARAVADLLVSRGLASTGITITGDPPRVSGEVTPASLEARRLNEFMASHIGVPIGMDVTFKKTEPIARFSDEDAGPDGRPAVIALPKGSDVDDLSCSNYPDCSAQYLLYAPSLGGIAVQSFPDGGRVTGDVVPDADCCYGNGTIAISLWPASLVPQLRPDGIGDVSFGDDPTPLIDAYEQLGVERYNEGVDEWSFPHPTGSGDYADYEDDSGGPVFTWGWSTMRIDCFGSLCLKSSVDDTGGVALRGWEVDGYPDGRALWDGPPLRTSTSLTLGSSWSDLVELVPNVAVFSGDGGITGFDARRDPYGPGYSGWLDAYTFDYLPNGGVLTADDLPTGTTIQTLAGGATAQGGP